LISHRVFHKQIVALPLVGLGLLIGSCAVFEKDEVRIETVGKEIGKKSNLTPIEPKSNVADPSKSSPPHKGPIRIIIQEAVLTALENNRSLIVERLNPSIQQTAEEQEQAVFDPVFDAEASAGRIDAQRLAKSGDTIESVVTDTYEGDLSLKQFFFTGTTVEVAGTTETTESSLYVDPFSSTRFGLTVTQALLRGHGADVNLAKLRQARLETRISNYELRGFTESLVAEVETTYWDYALARRRIGIFQESLKLAEQQLRQTKEIIVVGKLAEAEMAAVQAEVALQRQGLIDARSSMESFRLRLLRLLNLPGNNLWNREIILLHGPTLPEVNLGDVETHVSLALRMRPDLNQARLGIQQGDLEIARTKNGLLPVMELFVRLGKTGYAGSFSDSITDITGDNYDVSGGISFQYPFRNRVAKARQERALLRQDQAEKALDNLEQLAEVDVRGAYIEVNRAKEQIDASAATRKFQEEKLRIETEKFRVGRSTSFLVAQAQRDLLVSKINEVQAVANYLKALIGLYRQEGSLLERRGISAPGSKPVVLSKKNNP